MGGLLVRSSAWLLPSQLDSDSRLSVLHFIFRIRYRLRILCKFLALFQIRVFRRASHTCD